MSNKSSILLVSLCILTLGFFILASGCGANKTEPAKTTVDSARAPSTGSTEKQPLLADKPGDWKADGVIADNEYVKRQAFDEIEIYSRIDGNKVRIALKAKTNGFVAIGFGASDRMKDADIILGFVKDGKAVVFDMFSNVPAGLHPPDEQQGGNNDVTVFGGSKNNGVTIIEFERLLVTGDSKDKEIKIGDNKIIWSMGNAEAATEKHMKRGNGVLKL